MEDFESGLGKASMKHIAEQAGVSLMTVSRALKDNPRHSKATREKIQRIARELGYQPHPYVSALMSNVARTRPARATANLAVVHFNPADHPPRHRFYDGILARCQELGYQAEAFVYDPKTMLPGRLRKILLARGIRGIILMPAVTGFTSVDFDFSDFAVAALGHTIVDPPLPRVASDIYAGFYLALDEMIRRGYRRIGLINTEYINKLARYLYSAALLSYGEYVNPDIHLTKWIVKEPILSRSSLREMKNWIVREKLDAVASPTFDFPVYEILLEQGFEIPEKLGYLHLLNYPNPEVTYLDQNGEVIGAKAVDMVVAAINRNDFRHSETPYTLAVTPGWSDRETLPYKPGYRKASP